MKRVFPSALSPGATIGVVAPSSPPHDPGSIDRAVERFSSLGFKVVLDSSVRLRRGFLAGPDGARAASITRMFSDSKIDGIIALRGGYGAMRVLPHLDYRLIRRNPKPFIGFSDITALHLALLARAGLGTFHGPMLTSNFAKPPVERFTLRSMERALFGQERRYDLLEGFTKLRKRIKVLRSGEAKGPLIGGNLSVFTHMVGTPFMPSLKGAMLFLEDVNEAPYRIDRYLTHLANAGVFQQVSGVLLGTFSDCRDPVSSPGRQTMDDVFSDRFKSLRIPVLAGFPFGHLPLNATLPIGTTARVDTRTRALIVDRAVR